MKNSIILFICLIFSSGVFAVDSRYSIESQTKGTICLSFSDYGDYLESKKRNDKLLREHLYDNNKCVYTDFKKLKFSIIDTGAYKDYYYCKIKVYLEDDSLNAYVQDSQPLDCSN